MIEQDDINEHINSIIWIVILLVVFIMYMLV